MSLWLPAEFGVLIILFIYASYIQLNVQMNGLNANQLQYYCINKWKLIRHELYSRHYNKTIRSWYHLLHFNSKYTIKVIQMSIMVMNVPRSKLYKR